MTDRKTRLLIGWYEVVAGVVGLVMVVWLAPQLLGQVEPRSRPSTLATFVGMALVFAAVLLAGILVLRRHRWGRPLSAVIQLAQIPLWAIGPSRWVFFAGAYLAPLWLPNRASITLGLKSNLEVAWGVQQEATFVGVNLVPPIVLWLLTRKRTPPMPQIDVGAENLRAAARSPAP